MCTLHVSLQVWHRLDESSPLWKMREHLGEHLDGVDVSVSAFDMASEQSVSPNPHMPRSYVNGAEITCRQQRRDLTKLSHA